MSNLKVYNELNRKVIEASKQDIIYQTTKYSDNPTQYHRERKKMLKGLILEEVLAMFTIEEILDFTNFVEFYNEVDTYNAYEEEWHKGKYKDTYRWAYNQVKKDLL